MKSFSPLITIIAALVILTCFTGTTLAAEATNTMPNVSTGLPTITSEQFTAKVSRIVTSIYKDAKEISPM